jgi:cytochrome bd-type quinol oxidase subunit 2
MTVPVIHAILMVLALMALPVMCVSVLVVSLAYVVRPSYVSVNFRNHVRTMPLVLTNNPVATSVTAFLAFLAVSVIHTQISVFPYIVIMEEHVKITEATSPATVNQVSQDQHVLTLRIPVRASHV